MYQVSHIGETKKKKLTIRDEFSTPAAPKSPSLRSPFLVMSRFAGFTSRCTRPPECTKSSAWGKK